MHHGSPTPATSPATCRRRKHVSYAACDQSLSALPLAPLSTPQKVPCARARSFKHTHPASPYPHHHARTRSASEYCAARRAPSGVSCGQGAAEREEVQFRGGKERRSGSGLSSGLLDPFRKLRLEKIEWRPWPRTAFWGWIRGGWLVLMRVVAAEVGGGSWLLVGYVGGWVRK